mgnify:CR=1 FL=1|jgi:hypothetical protein
MYIIWFFHVFFMMSLYIRVQKCCPLPFLVRFGKIAIHTNDFFKGSG